MYDQRLKKWLVLIYTFLIFCFFQNRLLFIPFAVPENVEDEIVGSITFSEQFTARYGPVHPAFYQGTLDDAIKEACSRPAKDVSFLLINTIFII